MDKYCFMKKVDGLEMISRQGSNAVDNEFFLDREDGRRTLVKGM